MSEPVIHLMRLPPRKSGKGVHPKVYLPSRCSCSVHEKEDALSSYPRISEPLTTSWSIIAIFCPSYQNSWTKYKNQKSLPTRPPGTYHLDGIWASNEWETVFCMWYGHFEYWVMPFGQRPTNFQHFINVVLRDYLGLFIVVYFDDICMYSTNQAIHNTHAQCFLTRLLEHGKLEKMWVQSHRDSVPWAYYLHHGDPNGSKEGNCHTRMGYSYQSQRCSTFFGFANFYWRFILQFSTTVAPLTTLLWKAVPFCCSNCLQY